MNRLVMASIMTSFSFSAIARDVVGQIPEPGILPLLAIGAVAGLVAWTRKRNKK